MGALSSCCSGGRSENPPQNCGGGLQQLQQGQVCGVPSICSQLPSSWPFPTFCSILQQKTSTEGCAAGQPKEAHQPRRKVQVQCGTQVAGFYCLGVVFTPPHSGWDPGSRLFVNDNCVPGSWKRMHLPIAHPRAPYIHAGGADEVDGQLGQAAEVASSHPRGCPAAHGCRLCCWRLAASLPPLSTRRACHDPHQTPSSGTIIYHDCHAPPPPPPPPLYTLVRLRVGTMHVHRGVRCAVPCHHITSRPRPPPHSTHTQASAHSHETALQLAGCVTSLASGDIPRGRAVLFSALPSRTAWLLEHFTPTGACCKTEGVLVVEVGRGG